MKGDMSRAHITLGGDQNLQVWLSLFFNWAPCHDSVLGSVGIAPRILYLGTRCRWVVRSTSRPLYPQGKSPWYPLDTRLGGPQSRSGCDREEKNPQPPPELEPGIIQSVAQCIQNFIRKIWRKERQFWRTRCRWEDNSRMGLKGIGCKIMEWIHLAQDGDQWRAPGKAVIIFRLLLNADNFLTSWATVSSSITWNLFIYL
jgi:hypothetical protein